METLYEIETFKIKLAVQEPSTLTPARSSQAAVAFLRSVYAELDADQEHLLMLSLNAKNKIRACKVLATGNQMKSLVDPSIIFRAAILYGACRIIIAHNHPSNDPAPSKEDFEITNRLKSCAELFGIGFLDHIILAAESHFSFSDYGYLEGATMARVDFSPPANKTNSEAPSGRNYRKDKKQTCGPHRRRSRSRPVENPVPTFNDDIASTPTR
jgi:DNA repair protein RadC